MQLDIHVTVNMATVHGFAGTDRVDEAKYLALAHRVFSKVLADYYQDSDDISAYRLTMDAGPAFVVTVTHPDIAEDTEEALWTIEEAATIKSMLGHSILGPQTISTVKRTCLLPSAEPSSPPEAA